VSGSVRTFSTFTLQLVYSLHQQFKAVRSFVFIDRVDEVTHCFANLDVGEAVEEVYRAATVVDGDGTATSAGRWRRSTRLLQHARAALDSAHPVGRKKQR